MSRTEETITFRPGLSGMREGRIRGERREPRLRANGYRRSLKMDWFVDVFDRESIRREMERSVNEISLTRFRQMSEMSNR